MAGKWTLLTDVWYLHTREIGALYDVNDSTVKRWRRAGKLEAVVTPGGFFLHPVEQFAEGFPSLFPAVWPDWQSVPIPELLKPAEVEYVFRTTCTSIWRWHTAGQLTAVYTPGGNRRYPSDQFSREVVAKRLMSLNGQP